MVESKPDNAPDDLRISSPWPALASYCASFELGPDSCDDATHRHTPYLVLLVRTLRAWKDAHAGKPPSTSAERAAFKDALRSLSRSPVATDDDNVKEALAAAHKAWAAEGVPSDTRAVLDDPACAEASCPTGAFTRAAA